MSVSELSLSVSQGDHTPKLKHRNTKDNGGPLASRLERKQTSIRSLHRKTTTEAFTGAKAEPRPEALKGVPKTYFLCEMWRI